MYINIYNIFISHKVFFISYISLKLTYLFTPFLLLLSLLPKLESDWIESSQLLLSLTQEVFTPSKFSLSTWLHATPCPWACWLLSPLLTCPSGICQLGSHLTLLLLATTTTYHSPASLFFYSESPTHLFAFRLLLNLLNPSGACFYMLLGLFSVTPHHALSGVFPNVLIPLLTWRSLLRTPDSLLYPSLMGTSNLSHLEFNSRPPCDVQGRRQEIPLCA